MVQMCSESIITFKNIGLVSRRLYVLSEKTQNSSSIIAYTTTMKSRQLILVAWLTVGEEF
jgi:hypothetical protein